MVKFNMQAFLVQLEENCPVCKGSGKNACQIGGNILLPTLCKNCMGIGKLLSEDGLQFMELFRRHMSADHTPIDFINFKYPDVQRHQPNQVEISDGKSSCNEASLL